MKREKTQYTGVYQRGKTFSYRIRAFGGIVEKGGYSTAAQAHRAKNDALAAKRKGEYTRGTMTVQELCDKYLEARRERISEGSYENMRIAIHKYILPVIGGVKLSTLHDEHVYRVMNTAKELTGENRANTILKHLTSILHFGVQGRRITFNPCNSVKPFKVESPKIEVLTLEELNKLLSVCDSLREKTIVALGGYLGLRRGETFGLRWSDIDLTEGSIRIERQLSKGEEKETKTENSVRQLPMPGALREILRQFAEESFIKGRRNYLFVGCRGKRLQAERWCRSTFPQLVEKAGIDKHITFHNLRDSFATLNVDAGTDPGMLSKLMGHHSAAFTYDKYVKPNIDQKKKSIQNFDAMLGISEAKGN